MIDDIAGGALEFLAEWAAERASSSRRRWVRWLWWTFVGTTMTAVIAVVVYFAVLA